MISKIMMVSMMVSQNQAFASEGKIHNTFVIALRLLSGASIVYKSQAYLVARSFLLFYLLMICARFSRSEDFVLLNTSDGNSALYLQMFDAIFFFFFYFCVSQNK